MSTAPPLSPELYDGVFRRYIVCGACQTPVGLAGLGYRFSPATPGQIEPDWADYLCCRACGHTGFVAQRGRYVSSGRWWAPWTWGTGVWRWLPRDRTDGPPLVEDAPAPPPAAADDAPDGEE